MGGGRPLAVAVLTTGAFSGKRMARWRTAEG